MQTEWKETLRQCCHTTMYNLVQMTPHDMQKHSTFQCHSEGYGYLKAMEQINVITYDELIKARTVLIGIIKTDKPSKTKGWWSL